MLSADLYVVPEAPSASELMRLRESVGWTTYDLQTAERALTASLFAVTLRNSAAQPVGCARVIGDGHYLYVQDVIVSPGWQSHGGGTLLMRAVVAWLDSNAAEAYRALICPPDAVAFYQHMGFATESVAMTLKPTEAREP